MVYIRGASRSILRALEDITSYRVAGFMFSPAFRAKRWDGREHLLKYSTKRGYHAPVGLATDICRAITREGEHYHVTFKTRLKHRRRRLVWNSEIELRDYQREAVRAILGKPVPGSGIVKMPIRSGKTRTGARIIWKIGRPAIFIVPSQLLLYQTRDALATIFPATGIGMVGDSEDDPSYITVASIQTLAAWREGGHWKMKRPEKADRAAWLERHGWEPSGTHWRKGRIKPLTPVKAIEREAKDREEERKGPIKLRYRELIRRFDVAIFDECHHIRGESGWRLVMNDIDARFKIGLSATAYLDNESENERGIIWLKATCGPIRIDIPVSRLVEAGYLMRQNVRMYRVTTPDREGLKWSATLQRDCIVENRERNALIARLAAEAVASKLMKVIVIAHLHLHIAAICDAMDDLGLEYRTITGKDSASAREELIEGLVDGDYSVLIGNVLGEGIDIPEVECVINAEGGADIKSAVQRQRNLTVSEGKREALFIDFYDDTNDYFRRHSEARLEVYRSEESYDVEIVDEKKASPIHFTGRRIGGKG